MTFYKKISFWILAVLFLFLGFIFYKKYLTPVQVQGISVIKQDLEVTVNSTSTGVIESEVKVNITSRRTGTIIKLYFDEGDRVKAGDIIADLDPSEVRAFLKKTEAELKEAEFNHQYITVEYKRKEALFREELVTQQQFDDVQARLSIADAALERAEASRDIAQLQYDYSFIRSPVNGVVTFRPVDVGDTATVGIIIASVVNIHDLYISAPIDEADVDSVALGQQARITMDAYLGEEFYGKVIKISPVVTGSRQETRTFEVRISIPQDTIILKPGMSADIEIIVGKAKNALVVQSQAVIDKGTEQFVYVVEDGRVSKRRVKTGLSNWSFTELKKGLKEGETVIITPDNPGFKEGIRVKIVDSP